MSKVKSETYFCPVCGYGCTNFISLRRHVKKFHAKSCPICGFEGRNVVAHIRTRAEHDHRHASLALLYLTFPRQFLKKFRIPIKNYKMMEVKM
ncbi:MAG: hypothetical protein QXS54_08510 [Candidatus Methanomethylicaceae archaeon]